MRWVIAVFCLVFLGCGHAQGILFLANTGANLASNCVAIKNDGAVIWDCDGKQFLEKSARTIFNINTFSTLITINRWLDELMIKWHTGGAIIPISDNMVSRGLPEENSNGSQ